MTMHHPMICKFSDTGVLAELRMLLQKIPFPYRALTGQDFWNKPALLDKDAYYNDLTQEPISDERYEELKTITARFGITTSRELHDTYLHTDVLTLADCFETFRKTFHSTSGLDPFHYLGLPGAAWQSLLKLSGATIDNITQECCDS